jgi:osmotically-inducible protein OsmY
MKLRIQFVTVAAGLAIPITLLTSGCKEREPVPTMDSATVSSRTNDLTKDADNTARNVRDRNDATLTPGDQGNSPTDRALTQSIRKALVASTNGFSATAQNIKIITVDGKTTLRGPVKSEAEKMGIVMLAKNLAGPGNVEDQLEIKANP